MKQKASMPVRIPIDQAEKEFRGIARRAGSGKEHFVVEQNGDPEVVILSRKEFDELKQAQQRSVDEMSVEERLAEFKRITAEFNAEAKRLGLEEDEEVAAMIKDRGKFFKQYYGRGEE